MVNDDQEKKIYEVEITDENDESPQPDDSNNESTEQTIDKKDDEQEPKKKVPQDIQTNGELIDKLQRLQAEFVNYKKRVEKEKIDLAKYFKSEFIITLLPVIDDFEQMLNHAQEEESDLIVGIKLIYQKLIELLKKQGLETVETVGKTFNPKYHEAVFVERIENGEDNLITEEWRKGYMFEDRLLRPAQVKVIRSAN